MSVVDRGRAECAIDPRYEPWYPWVYATTPGTSSFEVLGDGTLRITSGTGANDSDAYFARQAAFASGAASPWVLSFRCKHVNTGNTQQRSVVAEVFDGAYRYPFYTRYVVTGAEHRLYYSTSFIDLATLGYSIFNDLIITIRKTGNTATGNDHIEIWVNGTLVVDDTSVGWVVSAASQVNWGHYGGAATAEGIADWNYFRYIIDATSQPSWDLQVEALPDLVRHTYEMAMDGDGLVLYDGLHLSAVSPATGGDLGGEEVVLSGLEFRDGATVMFGATPGLRVRRQSSTEIRCGSPPLTVGTYDITVINPTLEESTLTSVFVVTSDADVLAKAKALLKYLPAELLSQSLDEYTMQRALCIAWAKEICRFLNAKATFEQNLDVATASGEELDKLARNYGVGRVYTDMTDALFRTFIKATAWAPRGPMKSIRDALGPLFDGVRPVIREPDGTNRYFEVVIPDLGQSARTGYWDHKTYWGWSCVASEPFQILSVKRVIDAMKAAGVTYKMVAS